MFRLVLIASLLTGCRIPLESTEESGLFPRCEDNTVSVQCTSAVGHSDLAWIQQNIFSPNCASTLCHGGVSDLDLRNGTSYQTLVNKNSLLFPERKLVVPGDLSASYLLFVLGRYASEDANPPDAVLPAEGYMPANSPALCCQKHEAIERWILAGAPNN
jgi:hypothetical protein